MRNELIALGVTDADIQTVLRAASMGEARTRLGALKERAHRRYRELALELQRTGGDMATERFRAITEVYRAFVEVRPMLAASGLRDQGGYPTRPLRIGTLAALG